MPTYEYRCKACQHCFELTMTIINHEKHKPIKCPKCHGRRIEQRPSRFQAVTSSKA